MTCACDLDDVSLSPLQVVYGLTADSMTQNVTGSSNTFVMQPPFFELHTATMAGLKAATRYFYQISTSGMKSKVFSFKVSWPRVDLFIILYTKRDFCHRGPHSSLTCACDLDDVVTCYMLCGRYCSATLRCVDADVRCSTDDIFGCRSRAPLTLRLPLPMCLTCTSSLATWEPPAHSRSALNVPAT